jgi:hypothetical protein
MPRVRRLIEFASAAVRRYCRQTISLVLDDEIFLPSTGTTVLTLPERPVISVEDVEVQRSPSDAGEVISRAAWAESGWYTWSSFGILRRLDGLPWGVRYDPVRIVYTHGYEDVPDDIVGLVAAKVHTYRAAVASNPDGLKSLQTGAMSESYANFAGSDMSVGPAALTKAEKEMLDEGGYRLRSGTGDIGTQ